MLLLAHPAKKILNTGKATSTRYKITFVEVFTNVNSELYGITPSAVITGIKTSSGALLRLPICREQNFKTTINLARQYGFQIVASTEKGAMHYREVDFRQPTLLILGNEETGISPELLRMSDIKAKLPIVGEVASLNVSVAAGVMMYEALEQRLGKT